MTLEQMKCLASAPRQRVYSEVRTRERGSATDIAVSIGMSSESVHFHLKQLVKVGLISAVGVRATGRRPGATFEAVHQKLVIAPNSTSHDIIKQTTDATIRESHRQFSAAFDLARDDTSLQDSMLILRTHFRLNAEAQAKVKKLLLDAMEVAKSSQTEDGQLTGFLMLQSPVVPK
jgi:predicted ArsR family transcriptional regulator